MSTGPNIRAMHFINGAPYSIFVNPSNLQRALTFEPEEGDVIQVSYPRSGTHWAQQIIQLILNRGVSAPNYREFMERSAFLEFQDEDALKQLKSPRLITTHLPLGRIPLSKKAKYVYVARNPWDTCRSIYQIARSISEPGQNIAFNDVFEGFIKGERIGRDHFSHILSGYEKRHEPNVFFITYEQLKADTPGTVIKLAHFLGDEHGKAISESQDLLSSVLEKATVDYVKRILNTTHRKVQELLTKEPALPIMIKDDTTESKNRFPLVHKGVVGGWRSIFTRDQLRKMEEKIEKFTQTSDFMSLWEEEWALAREAMKE